MDTIEISNLNRQFLFRKRHVGKSKAEIAAEAVRSFCPEAKIVTLQNNVKESMFDMAFIKSFSIVLNGLDNDEARRHVNRLCLAADVPLVESGTTGYKGQAWSTPRCSPHITARVRSMRHPHLLYRSRRARSLALCIPCYAFHNSYCLSQMMPTCST